MAKVDPAVGRETRYIAGWAAALSLVMEAVFLLIGKWDWRVLAGNIGGGVAAVGSFYLLGRTVSAAADAAAAAGSDPEAMRKAAANAAARMKATAPLRLIGQGLICAALIGLLKTNPYATLIPLLFPRIGIMFRAVKDRKQGNDGSGTEGSELLD